MPQIRANGYTISYPPLIGEYGYYDSRAMAAKRTGSVANAQHGLPHYLINVDGMDKVGCHYSLSFKKDPEPFVTCQGIIREIVKKI